MFDGGYQPDFAGFKRVLLRQGEPDRVFFYELLDRKSVV